MAPEINWEKWYEATVGSLESNQEEKKIDPRKAMIEEVLTGERNARGIPTFRIDQIWQVPFNTAVIPWVNTLAKAEPRIFGNNTPMKVLYDSRQRLVPDYSIQYIEQGNTDTLPPEIETEVLPAIISAVSKPKIDRALKLHERKTKLFPTINEEIKIRKETTDEVYKALSNLIGLKNNPEQKPDVKQNPQNNSSQSTHEIEKMQTTQQTKSEIISLIGTLHSTIRDTYRVGNIQATEVIPHRHKDPLYCVRLENPSLDKNLNSAFRTAFVLAFAGRVDNLKTCLKQAGQVGEAAAMIAFCSSMRGATWSLAEVMFINEIVYGDALRNGFKRLRI